MTETNVENAGRFDKLGACEHTIVALGAFGQLNETRSGHVRYFILLFWRLRRPSVLSATFVFGGSDRLIGSFAVRLCRDAFAILNLHVQRLGN